MSTLDLLTEAGPVPDAAQADADEPGEARQDGDESPAAARDAGAVVWDDEQCVYVETDLPDLRPDSLEIAVDGRMLVINGISRSDGAVPRRRCVPLPCAVDENLIYADAGDDLLVVTLAKRPDAAARSGALSPDEAGGAGSAASGPRVRSRPVDEVGMSRTAL